MTEEPWYSALRQEWRPDRVRLLLVGESAPDPGAAAADRRFFYAPTLSRYDNLFRGVIDALYAPGKLDAGADRRLWLKRLRDDGVYLIDLVPYPVNKLSATERRRSLHDHVSDRVDEVLDLAPRGVIICHGPTFEVLSAPLRAADITMLHYEAIPFPLGNHRARFVKLFRAAHAQLDNQA